MYILNSHCVMWQLYLNKNIYRAEYLREGRFGELQRTSEGPLEPYPVYIFLFLFYFIFLTLQYCIGFAI